MKVKLARLAELVDGEILGNPDTVIEGIASIEDAEATQITFLANKKYARQLENTRAGAVIVDLSWRHLKKNLLVCKDPYLALAKIATFLFDEPYKPSGISSDAFLEDDVSLGKDISIHPFSYISKGCRIGDRVTIHPGVYLGQNVTLGDECLIYPNVTILKGSILGKRVIIHSGTVIGSDGFGYAPSHNGHIKIPQTGIVQIDDNVEIGANCTIDRATFGKTWIQRGVKIDNLVQIAHNVVVGENSILVSQVGISGSTRIGKQVILAGQVGVTGHLNIGDHVRVGAQSGIAHSVPDGSDMSGSPAISHRKWLKSCTVFSRLPQMRQKIRELEKKVQQLEKNSKKGI